MPTISEIVRTADSLNKERRRALLMVCYHLGVKIHEGGDGSRIDLNTCTPDKLRCIENTCTPDKLRCIELFVANLKPLDPVDMIE
jgi:hypothetical protein